MTGRMRELGRRHSDADLEALGLAFQGLVATRRGSLEEGGRLLDEAMESAVGGELRMLATGIVYCRMICACLALHDYRRAGEWTRAAFQWLGHRSTPNGSSAASRPLPDPRLTR